MPTEKTLQCHWYSIGTEMSRASVASLYFFWQTPSLNFLPIKFIFNRSIESIVFTWMDAERELVIFLSYKVAQAKGQSKLNLPLYFKTDIYQSVLCTGATNLWPPFVTFHIERYLERKWVTFFCHTQTSSSKTSSQTETFYLCLNGLPILQFIPQVQQTSVHHLPT